MTDKHAAEYSIRTKINLCVMYKLLIQQYSQKYQSPRLKQVICFVLVESLLDSLNIRRDF